MQVKKGISARAAGLFLLVSILLLFVSVATGFSVFTNRLDPMTHMLIAIPSTFVAMVAMALALPHLYTS